MGRGLGKLQQTILQFVQEQNRPVHAEEIATHVYWSAHPSHAAVVNVRRAIHALAARKVVQCGLGTYRFADHQRLYCWLPEHKQPYPPEKWLHEKKERWSMKMLLEMLTTGDVLPVQPLAAIPGEEVEKAVLDMLAVWGSFGRHDVWRNDLTRCVGRDLQRKYEPQNHYKSPRIRKAIYRAYQNLEAKGLILIWRVTQQDSIVELAL